MAAVVLLAANAPRPAMSQTAQAQLANIQQLQYQQQLGVGLTFPGGPPAVETDVTRSGLPLWMWSLNWPRIDRVRPGETFVAVNSRNEFGIQGNADLYMRAVAGSIIDVTPCGDAALAQGKLLVRGSSRGVNILAGDTRVAVTKDQVVFVDYDGCSPARVNVIYDPNCAGKLARRLPVPISSTFGAPAVRADRRGLSEATMVALQVPLAPATRLSQDPHEILTSQFEGSTYWWNSFQAFPAEKVIGSPCLTRVNADNRTTADVRIAVAGANRYSLARGSVLVYSDCPVVYDTPNTSLSVARHSAVILSVEPGFTRILDLTDAGRNSVVAFAGHKAMRLDPGNEMTICKSARLQTPALVLEDGLARRRMRISTLCDGQHVVLNDFSITDALSRQILLRRLRCSTRPEDVRLTAAILKMAASIRVAMDTHREAYLTPEVVQISAPAPPLLY